MRRLLALTAVTVGLCSAAPACSDGTQPADPTAVCKANRVYIATSADGGGSWSSGALADDPGAGDQQYRPRVADAAGSALVVWEDTRGGRRQLRYLVRKP